MFVFVRERERERSTNGERCQFECLDRYTCVCEVIDLLQNHPPEREGEREKEKEAIMRAVPLTLSLSLSHTHLFLSPHLSILSLTL